MDTITRRRLIGRAPFAHNNARIVVATIGCVVTFLGAGSGSTFTRVLSFVGIALYAAWLTRLLRGHREIVNLVDHGLVVLNPLGMQPLPGHILAHNPFGSVLREVSASLPKSKGEVLAHVVPSEDASDFDLIRVSASEMADLRERGIIR